MEFDRIKNELTALKEWVTLNGLRKGFQFSSYLEYTCRCDIGNFTEPEIVQASTEFSKLIQRRKANSAKDLERQFIIPRGAITLGLIAVLESFVQDLKNVPLDHLWIIWFCLEVIEFTALGFNPFDSSSFPKEYFKNIQERQFRFFIPTGDSIDYQYTDIYVATRKGRLTAVEMIRLNTMGASS